jgi:hypothetical protein
VSLRLALAGSVAAVALLVAVSATVIPALACSCAVAPSASSPTASNQVTFLGRVKNILPAADGSDLSVAFETLEGDQFGAYTRSVLTPASEAACGYTFRVGSTYEVHAHSNSDGRLVADSCSATQLSNRSLPQVGYPTDPLPRYQWVTPALVALAVIAALTGGGILLIRALLRR